MTTNYTQFQADILNSAGAKSSDPVWVTEFPVIIDRAEQRIYRDLDLLYARVTDDSGSLTAQNRVFPLPTDLGTFLVIEEVTVLSPAGTPSSGASRTPLVRCSPVLIDLAWPSNSSFTGLPEFFAMRDNANLLIGPVPDQPYGMEIRGTQRPTPLSSANSSTILTQMLPDLFFAAGMIEVGAFMRYTEPAIGITWSSEYDKLLMSAKTEELRKKFFAEGWTDKQPSPIATPPRV